MSRRAPEPEKPENHERWIVTYADMVTLLFALSLSFLVHERRQRHQAGAGAHLAR